MEKNLKTLVALTRRYDLSIFYDVAVTEDRVTLQGRSKPQISEMINKIGAKPTHICPNGFSHFRIQNIEIILT